MESVNEDELDWHEVERGSTHFRRKGFSRETDGEKFGCTMYELPPGGKSWPYHFHTGNEEAMLVLAGEGTVRGPDGDRPVRAGEYVAMPAGEEGGHRVVNDGDDPVRFVVFSTMADPDVIVYPDSEKIGVYAGSPPGSDEPRTVNDYFRLEDAVDYWDGET
ncbi:cupin domain-containing protein [Salinirarus marinus]|uniref:cupin domain-containing protein n=1 Tax=Salinirarus marinus TaxID=3068310 RepID=UPI003C6BFBD9